MRRTSGNRIKITELNANLVCVLCGGYYIDATTIIECLHSFCKSCIVRYLEANKYCPICDVQVHKTRPLQNIRSDTTLQHLVYKLVPGLYQNEMLRRRQFYMGHTECKPELPEDRGEIKNNSIFFSPDEYVKISLQYHSTPEEESNTVTPQATKRYLRCPAAVTVRHLQKLIRAKFGLQDDHMVEVLYLDEPLDEDFTLMDVAYIHNWCRKGLMNLSYRIFESTAKRIKIDYCLPVENNDKEVDFASVSENNTAKDHIQKEDEVGECEFPSISQQPTNSVESEETSGNIVSHKSDVTSWKEVQIQISESGVMSIKDITSEKTLENIVSTLKTNSEVLVNTVDAFFSDNYEPLVNGAVVHYGQDDKNFTCTNDSENLCAVELGTPVDTALCNTKLLEDSEESLYLNRTPNPVVDIKNKIDVSNVCDSSLVVNNKPSGASLGHMSLSEPFSSDQNTVENNTFYQNLCQSGSFNMNCAPQKDTQFKQEKFTKDQILKVNEKQMFAVPTLNCSSRKHSHTNSPIGYKTLKTPPKAWSPSLSRLGYLSSKTNTFFQERGEYNKKIDSINITSSPNVIQSQYGDKVPKEIGSSNTTTKPSRFFKMRNMPRFLGNPASGVKRMFQVVSPGLQKSDCIKPTYSNQPQSKQNNVQLVRLNSKAPCQSVTNRNSYSFSPSPVTKTHVDTQKSFTPGFPNYQKMSVQYCDNISGRRDTVSKNPSLSGGSVDRFTSADGIAATSETASSNKPLLRSQSPHIPSCPVQLPYGNLSSVPVSVSTTVCSFESHENTNTQSPSQYGSFPTFSTNLRQDIQTCSETEQTHLSQLNQTLDVTVAVQDIAVSDSQLKRNNDLPVNFNSNCSDTALVSDQHKLAVNSAPEPVRRGEAGQQAFSESDSKTAKVNTVSAETVQSCTACVNKSHVLQVYNVGKVTTMARKLPESDISCTGSNEKVNCVTDQISLQLQYGHHQNSDASNNGLSSSLSGSGLKITDKSMEILATNNNTEFFNKESFVHCSGKEVIPGV